MATAPKKAQLTSSRISWSSGEYFDGHLVLGLACPVPTSGAISYVLSDNASPSARIPTWIRIPVVEGELSTEARVLNNADLEPPNSRYAAFWYDLAGRRVAGPSALFEVSGDSYAIDAIVPTLTSPVVSTSAPVPEV
ncbi:MAG: hypothetical protein ABFD89_24450 [Bryobacteraceae bacterium]